MPIKPPNLDDLRYNKIFSDSLKLIPQYTKDWTNFNAADPGITLMQMFSWMTEMVLYRVNKVPDESYVHFLNFIGEERRTAIPSCVALTYNWSDRYQKTDESYELMPMIQNRTSSFGNSPGVQFLSTEAISIHDASVDRVIAVQGGNVPMVRDIPFQRIKNHESSVQFSNGKGIQFFDLSVEEHGPIAYTEEQYLYISNPALQSMASLQGGGILRILAPALTKGKKELESLVEFFEWEYPSHGSWLEIDQVDEEEDFAGTEQRSLYAYFDNMTPYNMDFGNQTNLLPEEVQQAQWWIRGRLAFEEWFAEQITQQSDFHWRNEKSKDSRKLPSWSINARGRTLEFALDDVPPILVGWSLVLSLPKINASSGHNKYIPNYKWFYRMGKDWVELPDEQVFLQDGDVVISGPLPGLASEGINIRAERTEAVSVASLFHDLDMNLQWVRSADVVLAKGFWGEASESKEGDASFLLEHLDHHEHIESQTPMLPFQRTDTDEVQAAAKKNSFFIGSDLFHNSQKKSFTIEIEYSFECDGEPLIEPLKQYSLQLNYRTEQGWQLVRTPKKEFVKFAFASLLDEKPNSPRRQKIILQLDPEKNLKGILPFDLTTEGQDILVQKDAEGKSLLPVVQSGDMTNPNDIPEEPLESILNEKTSWLRLDLVSTSLEKDGIPIDFLVHSVDIGVGSSARVKLYEEELPGTKIAQIDFRPNNPRLSRVTTRSVGRTREIYPFVPFIDIETETQCLYLHFDKVIPKGQRHIVRFNTLGSCFLPKTLDVSWEMLVQTSKGRTSWEPLRVERSYRFHESGSLIFSLLETPNVGPEGMWVRGQFINSKKVEQELSEENMKTQELQSTMLEDGSETTVIQRSSAHETSLSQKQWETQEELQRALLKKIPLLPPVSNILCNTVFGVNVHRQRTETYSGRGIPDQKIQLQQSPIYLHKLLPDEVRQRLDQSQFVDIRVLVKNEATGEASPLTQKGTSRKSKRKTVSNPFAKRTQAEEKKVTFDEWTYVSDEEWLLCDKNSKVFTVNPVDGILTFGNGIHGQVLPVGKDNVIIDVYHTVPGHSGNVAPEQVVQCSSMIPVTNLFAGYGGSDAESIDDIIQRAPSLLSERDRAITAQDFELIALAADTKVARAMCCPLEQPTEDAYNEEYAYTPKLIDEDGNVGVVILPVRHEEEGLPDPFLSSGLRQVVEDYVRERCLINIRPIVRLATFCSIDISLRIRLHSNTDIVSVRENVKRWLESFLDPYRGGFDQKGWPFKGTLYQQDISRMLAEIPEIRHLSDVELYDVSDKENHNVAAWDMASDVFGTEEQGAKGLLPQSEIRLLAYDLFHLRRIRIYVED